MKTTAGITSTLEKHPSVSSDSNQPSTERHLDELIAYMQDMERRRLGIVLRDNINQVLAAAKIFIGSLAPVDDSQDYIKQRTAESLAMAIEEIGKLTDAQSGPLFQETGLIDSINTLIDELGLVHFDKIRFTCRNKEIEALQPGQKIVLFRIIRESLQQIAESWLLKDLEIYLQFTGNRILVVFDGTLRRTGIKDIERSYGIGYIRDLLRIYKGAVKLTTISQRCLLEINIPL